MGSVERQSCRSGCERTQRRKIAQEPLASRTYSCVMPLVRRPSREEVAMPDNNDKWLTRQELADRLGLPVKTPAEWASKGTGPRYAKFGRHVQYRLSDVMDWEEHQFDRGNVTPPEYRGFISPHPLRSMRWAMEVIPWLEGRNCGSAHTARSSACTKAAAYGWRAAAIAMPTGVTRLVQKLGPADDYDQHGKLAEDALIAVLSEPPTVRKHR